MRTAIFISSNGVDNLVNIMLCNKPLRRNWLALSAVNNRKAGGSSQWRIILLTPIIF